MHHDPALLRFEAEIDRLVISTAKFVMEVPGWKADGAFGSIPVMFPSKPGRRSLPSLCLLSTGALLAAALALLVATATHAADEHPGAPIPAPGQIVPPHAAGGWPTDTTGDSKKPGRTAEQQAALDSVAGELKRLANECGPDSVVLQAKFLIRSMAAGAIGPTEVRVAGPSSMAGPEHLEIDVETGLYFDENATTADSRRDMVWKEVASPVLDEMMSFKIQPASLELVFLFDVQHMQPGETLSPTADARHEAFRIRIDRAVLDEIAADRLNGDAVREKAVFTPAAAALRMGSEAAR